MDKREGFIPKEDIEFEREIAEQERLSRENAEKLEAERAENEKKEREQYERKLQDQKIELVKLKQGVIDSSETVKELPKEEIKLSFGEWLSNVWYRSKWIIICVIFGIFVLGYIVYDSATRVEPDLTVLAISDNNAIYARTAEFENFFESFTEDINGDGEVYVLIYNISTDYSNPSSVTSSQAQLMTQLQCGDNMIVISDGTTEFAVHDFTGELEGDFVSDKGIKLNCALTREKLKWEAMPQELYVGLREPTRLLSTSEETMKKNYETALPTYMKLYEAIAGSEK